MKNFYVSCSVRYTDPNDGEPYNDVEFYSSIIPANSNKIAEFKGRQEALKLFNEDINNGFENIHCEIDECYETTDDARVD